MNEHTLFVGIPVHAGTLMYPAIVKKNRVSPWLVKELFPDHSGFFFPTKTLQKKCTADGAFLQSRQAKK